MKAAAGKAPDPSLAQRLADGLPKCPPDSRLCSSAMGSYCSRARKAEVRVQKQPLVGLGRHPASTKLLPGSVRLRWSCTLTRAHICMQTPRSPASASAASTPSAKDHDSGGWHSPLASWRSSLSSVSTSLAAWSPRSILGTSGIGVQLKKVGDNVAIKGLAPGGPAQVMVIQKD